MLAEKRLYLGSFLVGSEAISYYSDALGKLGELPSSRRRRGCGDERPEDTAGE